MRCPHCKANNPPENRLCLKCGRPLSDEGALGLSSSTAVKPSPAASAAAPTTATTPPAPSPVPSPAPYAAGAPASVAVASAVASTAVAGSPSVPAAAPAILSTTGKEGTAYRPSGACPLPGLGLMLAITIGSSVVVGAVYHLIGRFLDLVLISQLVVGLIVGAALASAIKAGKCRNVLLATAFAVLAGLLTYGTKLGLDAWYERADMVDGFTDYTLNSVLRGSGIAGAVDANGVVSPSLSLQMRPRVKAMVEKRMTPWVTFTTYMELAAEQGVSISHNGVGKGMPIRGNAYWIMLAAEVLLVVFVAGMLARGAAAEPFCERCDQWFAQTQVLRVHPVQNPLLLEKANAKDWAGLLDVPVGQTWDTKNHSDVTLSRCEKCSDATLTIKSTKGNSEKKLLDLYLGPQEGERFYAARQASLHATPPAPDLQSPAPSL